MSIQKAAFAFQLDGTPISCKPFGHGHINSTFKICTDAGKEYVLQRINKYVFKNPVWVMKNAVAVTTYLQERVDDPRMVLHFIPASTGKYYHKDEEGEFWRMTDFVGGFSLDLPESDEYSILEVNIPEGCIATYSQNGYEFTVINSAALIQPEQPSRPQDVLAQTGQLVWPIPVLALTGLFLVALGIIMLRKSRNSNG